MTFLKTSGLYGVQLFIRTATQKERIVVASSAFVYTNAYFALQNACWGHPKPFHSAPFRCRLRIPAERFLPGDALRVIEDLHQMGCRFI